MGFTLSTPALLFSAISIFTLAFTNRFHNVATLIRQFIASYQEKPDDYKIRQIRTFRLRLKIIKYSQAFGVLSFLLCAVSMIFVMFNHIVVSEAIFIISLISMVIALVLALFEILKSISALNIELERIDQSKQ
jgi:hypothetical protein